MSLVMFRSFLGAQLSKSRNPSNTFVMVTYVALGFKRGETPKEARRAGTAVSSEATVEGARGGASWTRSGCGSRPGPAVRSVAARPTRSARSRALWARRERKAWRPRPSKAGVRAAGPALGADRGGKQRHD